jgi:GMP synthase-like glutamine amidotransferase
VSPVRVLAVQHEDGTGPGYIGERICALGAELHVLHPYLGDPIPETTDGYAGLVVLGGTPGPYDDTVAPWLPDVRRLIAVALADGSPLLGICLGGELLAGVAGGKVGRIDGPPEIGVHPLYPTDAARTDPLFSGLPVGAPAVEWHWEEIVDLPPGSVALCGSERFPNQAFRVGAAAWGTQFHPEVLTDDAAAWARSETSDLGAVGLTVEGVSAEVEASEPELRRIWGELADRWMQVVTSSITLSESDGRRDRGRSPAV